MAVQTTIPRRSTGGILRSIRRLFFRTKSSKAGWIIILIYVAAMIIGPFVIPYSPTAISADKNGPPSAAHVLGTDFRGRDILSQLIWGMFPSMLVGITAALGAALLGLVVGVFGGYYNRLEGVLTSTADIVMTFPALSLMLLIGSLFAFSNDLAIGILILILWPLAARSIRSQTLTVKSRGFVDAAKMSGMGGLRIIGKIIIPSVSALAFAYFVLNVAGGIILITALEFLGVGNPNNVSWGSMLYWAQQFAFYYGDWWWILAPGLSISIIAIAFALIGFSIEEVANPKLVS
jgi:peptide/nickel transport system permease protein